MDGMKITIHNADGKVSRMVTSGHGDMSSDSITWPDAVSTVLDLLRGLGYCFSRDNADFVEAMEEVNKKGFHTKRREVEDIDAV